MFCKCFVRWFSILCGDFSYIWPIWPFEGPWRVCVDFFGGWRGAVLANPSFSSPLWLWLRINLAVGSSQRKTWILGESEGLDLWFFALAQSPCFSWPALF